jgi:tryptophan synthase alpha chain
MLPRIRAHVNVPVGVGFGIRDAATAPAVAQVADAVVIGSRLVQILKTSRATMRARARQAFMAEIRARWTLC